MHSPWAASAAHSISANSAEELRSALSQIPTGKYALAVYRNDDPKPYPVQAWKRNFPDFATTDGFGVVMTGIQSAAYAQQAWAMILRACEFLDRSDAFLNSGANGLIRKSLYPGPKLVEDE